MINEVCHTAGAALNPARRVALTFRLQEGGLMWSKWKADGNKGGRNGRQRSDATPSNKVTGGKRKEQRQPGRRYEKERRSDSLKRYKGVFDIPLPGAISAAEQPQRWWVKVSPDNNQWCSMCTYGQRGRKWLHSGLKRGGFSAEHSWVFFKIHHYQDRDSGF